MSYCINPDCSQPQNDASDEICRNCGSKLLLRDRYRAVKVLGQGGFGRTYLAIDQDRLNASCVIKQFLPQMQGTGALEKATELFNQEAVRLYDLGVHPQIPDLLAFFVQDKRQYLIQEFIPGMNLQRLLDRYGKFSEVEIWSVLKDILPILEFVHERQVIHRDIKPENIIRRQGDNLLFLIDFGVAKVMSSPDRVITGTSIGTSGYVALEQMSEGKAYPASDIYSLGVTCFHLLTGVSPYNLFLKRGYSWLQSWKDYVPKEVSSNLISVLDGMMQENRQDRYASATEALKDINKIDTKNIKLRTATKEDEEYIANFLKDIIITSPPPKEPAKDNIDDFSIQDRPGKTEILPEQEEVSTDALFEQILSNLDRQPDSIDNFSRQDKLEKTEILLEQKEVSTDALFEQILSNLDHQPNSTSKSSPTAETDSDDEFIKEFIQDIKTEIEELELPPQPVLRSHSLSQGQETTAQIWRCERTIRAHDQGCSYVSITPNETLITAGQRRVVQLWWLETGLAKSTMIKEDTCSTCGGLGKVFKEASLFFVKTKQSSICPDCAGFGTNSEKGERFLTVRLSADGNTLVTATLDKLLKFWHVPSSKFSFSLPTGAVTSVLGISGNGKIVSYVSQNRTIVVFNLEQNQEVGRLKLNSIVTCLDMNYEGKIIILGTEEGGINLWDVTSGLPPLNVKGHHSSITTISLSGDGMTAVSGCRDGMVKVWNLGTGNLVHTLKQHLTGITAIGIGADGLTLATGSQDGVLCLWHSVRGQLIETFPAHNDRITAIAAGPDGQTFASSSLDGTVKIWRSF